MRARWLVAVGVLGAVAGVAPALGADQAVEARSGTVFVPATVTINAGEQVTFSNTDTSGPPHDVKFDDRATAEVPASNLAWTASRRFDQPGRYPFRCTIHASAGMVGEVVVNAAAPPGTAPPSPTETTPPTGQPPVPNAAPAGASPPALGARVLTKRACTRRTATCRRPGIRIRVTAQEAVIVTGQLRRRARAGGFTASGRVRFTAPKGASTAVLVRRADRSRIGPGEYRLSLTAVRAAAGSDGTRSAAVGLRFTVRR